jgi:predicted Zn-dependent peptidase
VREFFRTFYAPNNAALVVVGDIDVAQTRKWILQYFGTIPAGSEPPRQDVSEPRQDKEKRFVEVYPRAPRPGLALGYHAPDRDSDAYYALALINQVLAQGPAEGLHRCGERVDELAREHVQRGRAHALHDQPVPRRGNRA